LGQVYIIRDSIFRQENEVEKKLKKRWGGGEGGVKSEEVVDQKKIKS